MNYFDLEKCFSIKIFLSFKNTNLNNRGYLNLYFVFFLTLLTSFMFAFAFIHYASQAKDIFRTTCITKAVDLQKKMIQSEEALFLLNGPSTALRLQLWSIYAALAVTPPPYDFPLLAELEIVQKAQQQLDLTQRKIIQSARLMVTTQYTELILSLNKNHQILNKNWSSYLNIFSMIRSQHLPTFSVRADSIGGTAPNYELETDYKSQQRVELIWQNWFSVSQVIQKIFNPKDFLNSPAIIRYGLICRIEPERINKKWDLKINVDRF